MKLTIRTITFSLIIILAVIFSSCLKSSEEDEVRTKATEQAEIDELISKLESQGIDVDTTSLGVYYIIRNEGEGSVISAGDTITIAYEAYHLSGGQFDATESWEFIYPMNNLIPGFNNALSIMKKDMLAEFIIPSELAYGIGGQAPVIDSYEPLIFAIKVLKIKALYQPTE